jgi:hypothetical protein
VKQLSRVVSPAGFLLVLVLFFLVPFLSVSCDVPGAGKVGVDYTGTHLITDATPPWEAPDEVTELLGSPGSTADTQVPAGVRVLAIVLVVLASAGVVAGLLPRVAARLHGSAALAAATLAVTVTTLLAGLSNLRSLLLPAARELGRDPESDLDPEGLLDDALRTELGFWLIVVVLVALLLFNVGAIVLPRRAAHRPEQEGT